jgi:hypothetical protein
MIQQKNLWVLLALINTIGLVGFNHLCHAEGKAHRILLDTDVDTDDVFALFYLLKLNHDLDWRSVCQLIKYVFNKLHQSSLL